MAWWGWVLFGWVGLSVLVALPMGLFIGQADRLQRAADARAERTSGAAAAPVRRRRVPVPPVAVAVAGIGVALEAVGFVVRSAGLDRGTARLWSMDAPMSVPRLYVTGLFVAAAAAAFLGSTRADARRAWWVGVGLVALVVAEVKGGGTVHVGVLERLGVADRPLVAAAGSAVVAAAVLATLWWLSRTEVRDRRRVLGAFGGYVVAAVGLSAVSSLAGPGWAAAATFVEESGEVLGAVAVLMAVLVGVAPRLVLPADWVLRRTADAQTVDAPGQLPVLSPGRLYR